MRSGSLLAEQGARFKPTRGFSVRLLHCDFETRHPRMPASFNGPGSGRLAIVTAQVVPPVARPVMEALHGLSESKHLNPY